MHGLLNLRCLALVLFLIESVHQLFMYRIWRSSASSSALTTWRPSRKRRPSPTWTTTYWRTSSAKPAATGPSKTERLKRTCYLSFREDKPNFCSWVWRFWQGWCLLGLGDWKLQNGCVLEIQSGFKETWRASNASSERRVHY